MTQSHPSRTWFITGASTGFGRHLAEEVLKAGGNVIATARNPEQVADFEQPAQLQVELAQLGIQAHKN